jgi:hypothetical protein
MDRSAFSFLLFGHFWLELFLSLLVIGLQDGSFILERYQDQEDRNRQLLAIVIDLVDSISLKRSMVNQN